jgi:hypothetical protein
MRELLYKVALLLALSSFLPLALFLIRRESPPQGISVKLEQKQTVEHFSLESVGGAVGWHLSAPRATFADRWHLELIKPFLVVNLKPTIKVLASRAVFDRRKGELYLYDVTLVSRELKASSPYGTYHLSKALFETDSSCRIISNGSETVGNSCYFFLKEKRFIVKGNVKTTLSGVKE